MALFQFDFKSEVLGLSCSLNAIVNQRSLAEFGPRHQSPVLYLLHGLSQDHTAWVRRSNIERYAEAYDLTIVMPAVHRSFYTNTQSGLRYFDFVADELPKLASYYLPISIQRAHSFVAGLSMGGYGAFKLALARPSQFQCAASLSGPLDLELLSDQKDELFPEWQSVFGPEDAYLDSENDLVRLAKDLVSKNHRQPQLYQRCGDQDHLAPVNQSFLAKAQALGLDVDFAETQGEHNWDYWDREIQTVLKWLPLHEFPPKQTTHTKDSTPQGEAVFKQVHE